MEMRPLKPNSHGTEDPVFAFNRHYLASFSRVLCRSAWPQPAVKVLPEPNRSRCRAAYSSRGFNAPIGADTSGP